MRRDTLTIPGLSHVVIRFLADNPGIWALHCHVAWYIHTYLPIQLPLTHTHLINPFFLQTGTWKQACSSPSSNAPTT